MSKKQIITMIGIILVLILGFLLYAFLLSKKPIAPNESSFTEGVRNFLPFGNIQTGNNKPNITQPENNTDSTTPDNTTTVTTDTGEVAFPKLRKLSTEPVSGSMILDREREVIRNKILQKVKEQYVRFMDRATGHILETRKDAFPVTKISNTTIPKVYEAIFGKGGERVVVRRLQDDGDTILSYNLALKDPPEVKNKISTSTPKGATSTNATITNVASSTRPVIKELQGTSLLNNIMEVAISPSKTGLLYLTTNEEGGKINLLSLGDNKNKIIFNYPLREWLLDFPSENTGVINTKPSGLTEGFAYFLNLSNGFIEKIAGGIKGFTLNVSPSLNYAILGTGGNTLGTSVLDIKKRNENILSIATLPEKCVWAKTEKDTAYCAVPDTIPPALYPDNWYQGQVSFSDQIWKVNMITGTTESVIFPERYIGESIDIIKPELSSNDSYMTFINKKDLSLWGLILKNDIGVASTTATSTKAKK